LGKHALRWGHLARGLGGLGAALGVSIGLLLLFGIGNRPTTMSTAQNDTPWGTYFYAVGRQIVAEATGRPVLFRGIAVPGMEYAQFRSNHPGQEGKDYTMHTADLYAQLAGYGFNVVRLPFDWGQLILAPNSELNTVYLSQLDTIVNEYAAPNRLYVILDMHSYLRYWDGPNHWTSANASPWHQALLVETWRLLARHYADNPAVLGYEIMNEPNGQDGDSNWPAIAQRVIDAIRTVDQRHLIFVDGRAWSSSEAWERANGPVPFVRDAINPPRLVYVPHVYFNPDDNDRYRGARPDLALMRRRLEPAAAWSRRNAVPVWIGESGVPNTRGWAALLDCAFVEYYNPLGWGHLYWEASPWSQDPTHLGPLTLAVLQRHLATPVPGSGGTAPTCADLRGY
jgi:hypothetical protein